MATISELNFNLIGTIAAFASTIGFALQSLYTKKSLRDLNIHPHVLLQHLTFYGLFMILSLWIFTDMPKIMEGEKFLRFVKYFITFCFSGSREFERALDHSSARHFWYLLVASKSRCIFCYGDCLYCQVPFLLLKTELTIFQLFCRQCNKASRCDYSQFADAQESRQR
jgi:hypothetical protein